MNKKIFLVLFLSILSIGIVSATLTQYERYTDVSGASDGSAQGMANRFQIGKTGANESFSFSLYSVYVPTAWNGASCNWTMWNGSVAGTGVALTSNTTNCAEGAVTNQWVNMTFNPVTLYAGYNYTLSVTADSGKTVYFKGKGSVTGWTRYYATTGTNWLSQDDIATSFQVWGTNLTAQPFISGITLNYPSNNSFQGNPITFNCSVSQVSPTLTNLSLYIDNANNYTKSVSGINFTDFSISVSGVSIGNHTWNCLGKNSSNYAYWGGANQTFNITVLTIGGMTYNSFTYETLNENYIINVSYDTSYYSSISANLIYNGNSYSGTQIGSGGTIQFSRSLIPQISNPPLNVSLYWIISVTNSSGTFNFNSLTKNQYVNTTNFGLCNLTLTNPYMNISFIDEANGNPINASIPTSTIYYWLGDGSINKSFTFTDNTERQNFTFCSNLNKTIYTLPYIQYKSIGYPQRIFNQPINLNSTITNKILYLLASTDGIYVTFQVLGGGGQPLSGVITTINRTINGFAQTISYGVTGNDGGVTFWLNPDFLHTYLFNKIGIGNYIFSNYPTQTLYTITLGGGVTTNFTDYTQGVNEIIQPSSDYINYGTIYSFNYTTTTNYWTLSQFGFVLKDSNGTIITTQSSAANGGIINYNMNATTSGRYIMNYYYVANSTYVNGSRYWIVQKSTNYSIFHFFTDLGLYIGQNLFGINGDEGNSNFGMALLSVVILVGVTGGMVMRYGVASEAAIMGLIFGLVLTLNSLGFIPNPSFITTGTLGNFIVYITFVLLVAFIYKGEQR